MLVAPCDLIHSNPGPVPAIGTAKVSWASPQDHQSVGMNDHSHNSMTSVMWSCPRSQHLQVCKVLHTGVKNWDSSAMWYHHTIKPVAQTHMERWRKYQRGWNSQTWIQQTSFGSIAWWHRPILPAVRRLKQVDFCEFEASLGYKVNSKRG